MELVYAQLVGTLTALWWPFVRVMAMMSAAPVVGEVLVPTPVRVLLSLVLAVVMLPIAPVTVPIDPFSAAAIVATLEQVVVGGILGIALQLSLTVILVLGNLISAQSGLSMALMNDPINGTSSDVITALLNVLCIMVFFAVDGHLLIVSVLGASFQAFPIGKGLGSLSMMGMVHNVAWMFSAALLLSLPLLFATLVVQIGFGFLNRVAPTMNLYSLGFSVVTLFCIFMLSHLVRSLPEHYIRMTHRVLDMIHHGLKVANG